MWFVNNLTFPLAKGYDIIIKVQPKVCFCIAPKMRGYVVVTVGAPYATRHV